MKQSKKLWIALAVLFLVLLSVDSYGQRRKQYFRRQNASARHIGGMKSFDASFFLTEHGQQYRLGGMYYILTNNSVRAGFTYERATMFEENIDVARYTIDGGYAFTITDFNGVVFINALGGVNLQYSTSNEDRNFNFPQPFNVGLFLGPELEFFAGGGLSLFINGQQAFYFLDGWGRWQYNAGLGLRYNMK